VWHCKILSPLEHNSVSITSVIRNRIVCRVDCVVDTERFINTSSQYACVRKNLKYMTNFRLSQSPSLSFPESIYGYFLEIGNVLPDTNQMILSIMNYIESILSHVRVEACSSRIPSCKTDFYPILRETYLLRTRPQREFHLEYFYHRLPWHSFSHVVNVSHIASGGSFGTGCATHTA